MASVFNRLIEPVSEHEMPLWCSTVALDELLDDNLSISGDDRFYRVSDLLLSAHKELEKYLCEKEKSIFNLDRAIILYDLTNSYFEGECLKNPKAKRGHSKEKRRRHIKQNRRKVLVRNNTVFGTSKKIEFKT